VNLARSLLLLVLLVRPGAAQNQEPRVSEYQLKAAFLFNFAQFVAWPPDAALDSTAPFVIGVLGDDPFGPVLEEAVRGEHVGPRGFEVRRFRTVGEITRCDILFISRSETDRMGDVLTALDHRPLLTVSDADGFERRGGMIHLVTDHSRIRLRINLDAATAARLTISSKLLRLAEVVGTARPPG
jgi:hypothetical protein